MRSANMNNFKLALDHLLLETAVKQVNTAGQITNDHLRTVSLPRYSSDRVQVSHLFRIIFFEQALARRPSIDSETIVTAHNDRLTGRIACSNCELFLTRIFGVVELLE